MTVWFNKDTTSVVACTQIVRVSVILYDEYNIVTVGVRVNLCVVVRVSELLGPN